MIKILLRVLPIFALIVSFLYSCSDNDLYKSEIEIPSGIWVSNKAATFKPEIKDTIQLFDINLSISNSNDYRYSNIWLFIKSVSPKGFSQTDTVQINLAEDDGKWLGNKNNDNFTLDIKYKKQIRFPKPGKYIFEIIQGMRDINLHGIYKIGFSLNKSK
jgi:gliding motility-associated lipoprotein GldH